MSPVDDNPYLLWRRNVKDEFKSLSNDEIKESLKKNAPRCAILIQNIQRDLNIGTIIRSANAFGIIDLYMFGARRWDKRADCGTRHYINIVHLSTLTDVMVLKDRYRFVAIENNIDQKTRSLFDYVWPQDPLILFGEESIGLSKELLGLADDIVEIPISGSVRSMNVGSCATAVMYDYAAKMRA